MARRIRRFDDVRRSPCPTRHAKRLLGTVILSLVAAVALIVHGVFFDLDFTQLWRLTIGGFLVTFVVVLVFLLMFEWILDLDDS